MDQGERGRRRNVFRVDLAGRAKQAPGQILDIIERGRNKTSLDMMRLETGEGMARGSFAVFKFPEKGRKKEKKSGEELFPWKHWKKEFKLGSPLKIALGPNKNGGNPFEV
jgi:hypothetical protein